MEKRKFDMTKRDFFTGLMNGSIDVKSDMAQERLAYEISVLGNTKTKKVSDKDVALTNTILEVLATGGNMRVTDIALADDRLSIVSGVSPQKISYIVNHNPRIGKKVDKKVSYFFLKTEEVVED